MSGSEILLILLAILVLFGADKLPGFARSLGKGLREIKKATDEIKEEITKQASEITNELNNVKDQALEGADKIKRKATDLFDIDSELKRDDEKKV